MSAEPLPIVVGVDGSAGADAALRWAIDDARTRHCSIRLTHAYRRPPVDGRLPAYADLPEVELRMSRGNAERVVNEAVDLANEIGAGVDVEGDAVDGEAARVLLAESEHASVVVLGSRHRKAFGSIVLGSVSAAVAARAACPAVVMRGPAGSDGLSVDAGVVVGVDGTDWSDAVLAFGFDHASRHRAPLRVVLCWHPETMWQVDPPPRAERWLSETLETWRAKYPEVAVHVAVVREQPVTGLVQLSTDHRLLIVGSRGRHALAGTLLGSVSQGVLHHATCPVAVIPTHTR